MRSTASAMLSRCWTFTVVMTLIPASSSSMTSCHRFSLRPDPGTLVWASSSTRATSGRRARTASRSISSKVLSAVDDDLAGHDLQVTDELGRAGTAVGLHEADDDVGAPTVPAPALVEHGEGLAHAGHRPHVDAEAAGRADFVIFEIVGRRFPGRHHVHIVPEERCPGGPPSIVEKHAQRCK